MTEQITDQANDEAVDEAQGPVEAAQEPQEAPEQDEAGKGNSEAAKWRVRFREAEQQIATLQARVNDMQAAEVSRLATGPGKLHDGQDLLLTSQLADLVDDEGNIDPERVAEAVAALVEKKPHLAKPAYEGTIGAGESGTATGQTWADIITG